MAKQATPHFGHHGAALVAGCALALTLAASPGLAAKGEEGAAIRSAPYVAQKGPAPGTATPTAPSTTPFATVPGGSVGGLVFANLDDLRLLVAEVGSARMDRADDGTEYIAASIDGINYAVDVYNCEPDCADLTFTASFEMDGVTESMMNEWNASRRFGKAYLRDDGDAVIQFAINARHGITVETFRDDLVWWESVLEDYVSFIGFR